MCVRHICAHTTHTYKRIRAHVHTHTLVYIQMCTHVCAHVCMCAHTYTHPCTHISDLKGTFRPPDPSAFHLLPPPSPSYSFHRRNLQILEMSLFMDPCFTPSVTGTRDLCSSGCPSSQLVCSAAPQSAGFCARHCPDGPLGSGLVPCCSKLNPALELQTLASPCPVCRPQGEPLQPAALAAAGGCCVPLAKQNGQVSGPSLCIYRAATCRPAGGLNAEPDGALTDTGHPGLARPRDSPRLWGCRPREADRAACGGAGASEGEGLGSQGHWYLGDPF